MTPVPWLCRTATGDDAVSVVSLREKNLPVARSG